MKNLPVYQNLDTSFVNLAALVRYLRGRRFAGNIRIELNGYEADVTIDEENQLKVEEYDRLAGRIAEGEEAFQRLLIRAREPGGTINVYQNAEETGPIEEKIQLPLIAANTIEKPSVQPEILARAMSVTSGAAKKQANVLNLPPGIERKSLKTPQENAPLPFEFTNRVEERAREMQMSPQDWQIFLELTAELLNAIDKTLAKDRLDFASAFAKACTEISSDYPFLNPSSADGFSYVRGESAMRRAGAGSEQVSAKLFAAGINEALRRILEKLRTNPKFTSAHRQTSQAILSLIHQRKAFYDKFFITPQLEKTLGI